VVYLNGQQGHLNQSVSDFRMLMQALQRKIYLLPKIQDVLCTRKGYKFFTKIDLNMQYYTFELKDEEKSRLCIIVTSACFWKIKIYNIVYGNLPFYKYHRGF